MEFTSTLNDSNVFNDHGFAELKLHSPSPFSKEKDLSSTTSGNLSPIKAIPLDDNDQETLSLSQELHDKELRQVISKFDLFKLLLSKVGGKDRLAKVSQYSLNLIKLYLINTRRFIVDEKFNNLSPDPRLHYKTPIKYVKLLLFLNSTMVEKKIFEVTKNISAFRYALRFGGTPLRVRAFLGKLDSFMKAPTWDNFSSIYLNEDFLGDFIDLWYGIFDELELLFKINVLTSPQFKSFVTRQGALAWYADILLGLKKNWCKLRANRERQLQINIQHQVRQRASILSKRLVENIGSTPLRQQLMREFSNKSPVEGRGLVDKLKSLRNEERIILLDLVRLSFDLVCDTIDVFDVKLPPAVYLVSGLISGSCGLSKVWYMCIEELESS
jgi:hypothetical protein